MFEIVKVKSTGEICTVVAAYIHTITGAELLELQPVGRRQLRYVRREAVEAADNCDLMLEVKSILARSVYEINITIEDEDITRAALDDICATFSEFAGEQQ